MHRAVHFLALRGKVQGWGNGKKSSIQKSYLNCFLKIGQGTNQCIAGESGCCCLNRKCYKLPKRQGLAGLRQQTFRPMFPLYSCLTSQQSISSISSSLPFSKFMTVPCVNKKSFIREPSIQGQGKQDLFLRECLHLFVHFNLVKKYNMVKSLKLFVHKDLRGPLGSILKGWSQVYTPE